LEKILSVTIASGPRTAIAEARTILNVREAKSLCAILKKKHCFDIDPFDFPRTRFVWQSYDKTGVPYTRKATKKLIVYVAKVLGVDYRTKDGFKAIMPELTYKDFIGLATDPWQTTLRGVMLNKEDSPYEAIMDVVNNDPELKAIKKYDLQPYDFPVSKQHTWKDSEGNPTPLARKVVRLYVETQAKILGVNSRSVEGFLQLLPEFTQIKMNTRPINEWDTIAGGMLDNAYQNKPKTAIMDLIEKDLDYHFLDGVITPEMIDGEGSSRLAFANSIVNN